VLRVELAPRLGLGHGQRGGVRLDGGCVEDDVGAVLLRQRLDERLGQPTLGQRLQRLPQIEALGVVAAAPLDLAAVEHGQPPEAADEQAARGGGGEVGEHGQLGETRLQGRCRRDAGEM